MEQNLATFKHSEDKLEGYLAAFTITSSITSTFRVSSCVDHLDRPDVMELPGFIC